MTNFKLAKEQTKDLNVLYVEDDLVVSETTADLLDNYFLTLDIEHDGQAGLSTYLTYAKEYSKHYDLVITDIKMPKMNGLDMVKEILKSNPDQPIIIVTSMNELETLHAVLECGVDGFITKPMKNEQLMRTLYKVGHTISNTKLLESHLEMIEDLNMSLEIENQELIKKNKALQVASAQLDSMEYKTQIVSPQKTIKINEEDKQFASHFQEQIDDLINDDLFELREIHTEIDLLVIRILAQDNAVSANFLEALTDKFTRYSSILSFYTFFDKLAASMKSFAKTIKENPIPSTQENAKNTLILLENFIHDLGEWQVDIWDRDINNINTLDASMISDMETIVNMWIQNEDDNYEEALDNIFDF